MTVESATETSLTGYT